MKCMIQERNKIIPNEENLIWAEDQVGNVKRLSLRSLGEREVSFCWERSKRMRENRVETYIYIENHKAQWIERCRELSRFKTRETAIEKLSRICREVSTAKKAWWIEELSSIQKLPRWIEKLSSSHRECNKKKLKGLDR